MEIGPFKGGGYYYYYIEKLCKLPVVVILALLPESAYV